MAGVSDSWRESFKAEAQEFIADFVASNPDYALSSQELTQGWSNYVALGSHLGEPVVYKYHSMAERWTNELFCLRHFAPTRLVPDVHGTVDDQLIVMSFVPGTMPRRDGLDEAVRSSRARQDHLSRQLGQATGKLVSTPLPTDANGEFPPPGFVQFQPIGWTSDLRRSIEYYVELARRICKEVLSLAAPVFLEYLSVLEDQAPAIDEERKILFHSDFGNFHVVDGMLQRFFDLESCRIGSESMQLSKALLACKEYGLRCEPFLEGYEEATGSCSLADDHLRILAMTHLEYLILRTCSNGKWSGTHTDRERTDRMASDTIQRLRDGILQYRDSIDLERWFPSLAAG